jgi:predicted amidohydrolase|tara:strand:+ start:1806 stop:2714 length:909 start_codon:yes stop_codon:yes gene_type:complete
VSIRAAAIQLCPVDGSPESTLQKAEEYLDRSAKEGVEIAVLPEGYLPGYAEIRKAKQSSDPQDLIEVLDQLDSVPGPSTDRIANLAKTHEMVVAFGMLARAEPGEQPTNVSVLIDSDGEIKNIHRKVHLTPTIEAPDFTSGNSFAVTETSVGTIGNMICADFSLPETTRILAIKGAQVVCGSFAGFYGVPPAPRGSVMQLFANSHMSVARAIDNSINLVMCNMVGFSGDLEFFGMSRIIDAEGNIVAQAGEGAGHEELLIGDLPDSKELRDIPFRLIDRRRPDLYSEILESNPDYTEVEWSG